MDPSSGAFRDDVGILTPDFLYLLSSGGLRYKGISAIGEKGLYSIIPI